MEYKYYSSNFSASPSKSFLIILYFKLVSLLVESHDDLTYFEVIFIHLKILRLYNACVTRLWENP